MRILLTARPLTGHVQPLLPLAAAAARRGHEVAFATGEPVVSQLRDRGLKCLCGGPRLEARVEFDPRAREISVLDPEERRVVFFAELFVGIELEPRLDDLVDVIDDGAPDVLLHEAAELAGPIAATLAGIPYVTVGFGASAVRPRAGARGGDRRAALAGARARAACRTPGSTGTSTSTRSRPRSSRPGSHDRSPARPAHAARRDRHRVAPAWLAGAAAAAHGLRQLRHVWNRRVDLFRAVLDAVDGLAVNIVITLGANGDPAALGPQPANVQVHRFVPQAQVLPLCDAVICHGGSGTMLGALAHGLP